MRTRKANGNGKGLDREAIFKYLVESYNGDYEPVREDEFTSVEFRQDRNMSEVTIGRILRRNVANGVLVCRWAYSPILHRKVKAYKVIETQTEYRKHKA